VERGTFVEVAGITQPAPAPRFGRTVAEIQRPPAHTGQHTDEVLADWLGVDAARISELRGSGAIA
jgi:alpha-methylacyl-CoA racemase